MRRSATAMCLTLLTSCIVQATLYEIFPPAG